MKNTTIIDEDNFWAFALLSIFFILIHLACVCIVDPFETSDAEYPIIHLFVLVILFAIFLWTDVSMIKEDKKEYYFNLTEYQISNEYTINLKALSDTHTTNGNIKGSRFYINGSIQDNYEIYYSFIDEKGSTVIRHFTYDENLVEIYEEENCTNPRIEFTIYSKSFEDLNSSYTKYVIHIPEGTNGISMDME